MRHAALAWRFVQWARTQGSTEQAAAIDAALRDAIEAARAQLAAASPVADTGRLRAHGVLAPCERIAIRRAALRDVVAGCAAAIGCASPAATRVRA